MSKQAVILLDKGTMASGVVENLIEITAEAALGITLPEGRMLWDCGSYDPAIGDSWCDGCFVRNGQPIEPSNGLADEVAALNAQLGLADDAAIELYEAQLMQSDINAAQDDALIELYEAVASLG